MIKQLGVSKKAYRIALTIASVVFLSTINISGQQLKTLKYLYSISGKKTLSGMHNDQLKNNNGPTFHTDKIAQITGKYPAVWASDFSFDNRISYRKRITEEAERQWNQGVMVSLSWHACPPTVSEPCDWYKNITSNITDSEWQELITDGTYLNKEWKRRMDDVVTHLQYLQSKGVEVLWRPFHEMNKPKHKPFWWTGRKGPNGSRKLYQIMHDYFVKEKGLTNLVWIWSVQDTIMDFQEYNPGSEYWDMLTIDIYENGLSDAWYNYVKSNADNKPIGIGECLKLPSPGKLDSQPLYTYFLGWADHMFDVPKGGTTPQEIKNTYNSPRVITRDEMPGWGSTPPPSESNIAYKKPVSVSSTEAGTTLNGANGVDGLSTTRWASLESDSQWFQVDLEAAYNIDRVKIFWEAAYGKDYKIEVFDNTINDWTSIKTVKNNTTLVNDYTGLSGTGRHIRINGTKRGTQWGYSIWELEVYGKPTTGNKPPTVSITSPVNNALYSTPVTINITATASDTDGTVSKVDFYNGTTLLGSDTTSPYNFNWTGLTAGNYSITAVATDNENLATTSSIVSITVKDHSTSPVNLALLKSIKVSSIEATSLKGDYAVDGDASTRWASLESDPQWIQVDLEAIYDIDRVKITWETAYGKDYKMEVSDDTATWRELKTVKGNTVLVNDHTGISGAGRYIKISGIKRGTQWGYSIYELEVYGKTRLQGSDVKESLSIRSIPNPVIEQATIAVKLVQPGYTTIELVNLKGITQTQIFSGHLDEGNHSFTIAKNLPSGIYFCSVTQNGNKISTTIIKK